MMLRNQQQRPYWVLIDYIISLSPDSYGSGFICVILECILIIDAVSISGKIAFE